MPSFRQVLEGVSQAWTDAARRGARGGPAARVGARRADRTAAPGDGPGHRSRALRGGRRRARVVVRHPQRVVGRRAEVPAADDARVPAPPDRRRATRGPARSCAFTLDKMADGGIRDQLGGGFHRYATDARWLVPHFEQMLYDNAQLARVYLHAWAVLGGERERYREVATGVLDYMLRELTTRRRRVRGEPGRRHRGHRGPDLHLARGGDPRGARADGGRRAFAAAYGVTDDGNWEGVTILSRVWPAVDEPPFRDDAALEAALAASRARCWSGARRGPAGARRQGARGLERAGDRGLRRGRAAARGGALHGRGRRGGGRRSSAGCSPPTGRSSGRGRTAGRSGRACSRTTPTSPRACSRCTRRPSTSAGSRSRAASRTGSSSGSPTRPAGSSTRPTTTSGSITRPKDPQDNAVPVGWRDGGDRSCCGWRR